MFCPKCTAVLEPEIPYPEREEDKDIYRCPKCKEIFNIKIQEKTGTIKPLWRHTGGGTMLVEGESYPSDDSYACGEKRISITCTTERHFSLPRFVESLSELIVLDGINPESKKELRELIEG